MDKFKRKDTGRQVTGKALDLSVYYNSRYRKCAAGGITEHYEDLLLIGTSDDEKQIDYNIDGYIDFDRSSPPENAVILVRRTMGERIFCNLVSYSKWIDGKWYMFGGNYASTSDSRLGYAIESVGVTSFYGALAVHDRTEGF